MRQMRHGLVLNMKFVELDIPAAGIWKRDCELVDFKLTPALFFSFNKESDNSQWRVYFDDYVALKITTEEFTVHLMTERLPQKGSFFKLIDSPWILELGKVNKEEVLSLVNHYIFFFYDEVIEVIAGELRYEILKEPKLPPQKSES